jgi:EpsI family protein
MRQSLRVALSTVLLLGALLMIQLRGTGEAVPIRKPLDSFPSMVGEWRGREATILEVEILTVLKAKDYVIRRYEDPAGRSLWLYIGYWDTQRKGAQPHSPRNCLPGGGWEPLEASLVTIPLAQHAAPMTVNSYLIQKDRDQQVAIYWYQSQGKAIAGELAAKMEVVKNSIVRHRTDGAVVRVSAPVQGTVQETSDRLVRYIQAMYPLLGEYLPD